MREQLRLGFPATCSPQGKRAERGLEKPLGRGSEGQETDGGRASSIVLLLTPDLQCRDSNVLLHALLLRDWSPRGDSHDLMALAGLFLFWALGCWGAGGGAQRLAGDSLASGLIQLLILAPYPRLLRPNYSLSWEPGGEPEKGEAGLVHI